MLVVQINQYGDPSVLKLVELPIPQPQPGEVLVKIHAASINPVDAKTRRGSGVAGRLEGFPIILGWDISGTVEALGEGVSDLEVGDEVYGMIRFPQEGKAYAEYATAPADHLARKPQSLNHLEAAALPLAALTGWQALEAAHLGAGQRVLIHGAGGGVGHLVAQLAKARGAEVWGTASGDLEFLSSMGVDHPINYITTRFDTAVQGMDMVFTPMPGETQTRSLKTLKPGGHLVSIVGLQVEAKELERLGVHGKAILVHPSREHLEQIAKLCDEGKIKPHLSAVLPLSEVVEAHKMIETGKTRGKIVLQVV